MVTIPYKNNHVQIKQLLTMLKPLTPQDDIYEYLMNELLVQVYTSYENFLKKLLISLFSEAKENYKYSPFLVEHSLWNVIENDKYIVPKGKIENLFKNYPLLKQSYFCDELSSIDTLVSERNSFAHTGTHKATLEQILTAYVTIQYIINYLEFCYIDSTKESVEKLNKIQVFLNEIKSHVKKCLKKIKVPIIPEDMRAFERYIDEIIYFKENDYFSIHPAIEDFFTDDIFLFLENHKGMKTSDFEKELDNLEKKVYLATFKVENKENVTIDNILNTFFN